MSFPLPMSSNNGSDSDFSLASICYISRSGDPIRLTVEGNRLPKHAEFANRAERHPLASLAYLPKREDLFVFSLLQGQEILSNSDLPQQGSWWFLAAIRWL
ncbi:hypothetical protein SAMN04488498_1565 [Mesorhizobium albiziae]|uniref:Uncharacterized protein n=1 Tax=Neomesorhizobium albiziae TaxID=335020 RepID=A0A1I4FSS3_9HYPH|nr:hypothetical protein SAMN04488498_1565 [Mesorhizobium albiziae]